MGKSKQKYVYVDCSTANRNGKNGQTHQTKSECTWTATTNGIEFVMCCLCQYLATLIFRPVRLFNEYIFVHSVRSINWYTPAYAILNKQKLRFASKQDVQKPNTIDTTATAATTTQMEHTKCLHMWNNMNGAAATPLSSVASYNVVPSLIEQERCLYALTYSFIAGKNGTSNTDSYLLLYDFRFILMLWSLSAILLIQLYHYVVHFFCYYYSHKIWVPFGNSCRRLKLLRLNGGNNSLYGRKNRRELDDIVA